MLADQLQHDDDVPTPRPPRASAATSPSRRAVAGRPWVGILFDCCGVYARIYRQPGQAYYLGYCPRCRRVVRLRVGPEGTDARFFRAY